MRIQVIGLCRFSVPLFDAFQSSGTNPDENRAIIYNPKRLEKRMRWFENLCLPPLLWQTDQDFILIVMTGTDLPEPWASRLQQIADSVPQIRLVKVEPGDKHGQHCLQIIADHIEPDADIIAQFRLDDDDAVALDYIQTIRRDYELIRKLMAGSTAVAVEYGRGLILHQRGETDFTLDCEITHFWGCGLTMYFPNDRPRSVMFFRHYQMWMMAKTMTIHDRIMWIRGFHSDNDSPSNRRKYVHADVNMTQKQLTKAMTRRFGLDYERLTAALAGETENNQPSTVPE